MSIAAAFDTNQTTNTDWYTLIQLQFITNGGNPSICPGFHWSVNSLTVAKVQKFRSLFRPVSNFFDWMQNWRAILSFYSPIVAM